MTWRGFGTFPLTVLQGRHLPDRSKEDAGGLSEQEGREAPVCVSTAVVSAWWMVDEFGFLFMLSCISCHEQALRFHSLKGN